VAGERRCDVWVCGKEKEERRDSRDSRSAVTASLSYASMAAICICGFMRVRRTDVGVGGEDGADVACEALRWTISSISCTTSSTVTDLRFRDLDGLLFAGSAARAACRRSDRLVFLSWCTSAGLSGLDACFACTPLLVSGLSLGFRGVGGGVMSGGWWAAEGIDFLLHGVEVDPNRSMMRGLIAGFAVYDV
jgi:hypothetical protein